ncbi:hypothetical protein B0H16DRAFT_1856267 [Mycena metata]|uniref:Uncharacterized protein n=1 Tax=Mycena metata TaxID=1033252 RepID=A0AAD7N4G7_9AGAR|nr:hypothetical protein B0H16DRAFT_1856267 [Mycena metata]
MNSKKNIFIVDATNRPDQIDSALLRPIVSTSPSTSPSPTTGRPPGLLQKVPRLARVSIQADIRRTREKIARDEAAGEDAMKVEEDADEEDPIPEITRFHFKAMSFEYFSTGGEGMLEKFTVTTTPSSP